MFTDFDTKSRLFAVLRHPIERMVSELKWEHKNNPKICGKYNLTENKTCPSAIIRTRLFQWKQDQIIQDCHYLGQHLFVTDNSDNLLPNINLLCFESLDNDLQKLLPQFRHSVNLTEHERNENEKGQVVFEQDIVQMIKKIYARDFELHRRFCSKVWKGDYRS